MRAAADHNSIITCEGFNLIDDLAILEGDSDVIEMAKRMASHMEANGCVNLSTITIKHLQGLVYYVRDRRMHGMMMTAKDWMQEAMETAMTKKEVKKASKMIRSQASRTWGSLTMTTLIHMKMLSRT